MKRLIGVTLVALLLALLPATGNETASAQTIVLINSQVAASADAVVNGTVRSSISVEFDGAPFTIYEFEVDSEVKGETSNSILVAVLGGTLSDGTEIRYTHQAPDFGIGAQAQLGLSEGPAELRALAAAATGTSTDVYMVSGGEEGVAPLAVLGFNARSEAGANDFVYNGATLYDFSSPENWRINTSGAGYSGAVTGAKSAFDSWEDDLLSHIDFKYLGTSSVSGFKFGNNRTDVSFVTPTFGNGLKQSNGNDRLAIASFLVGSGDAEVDIILNNQVNWTNGAGGGSGSFDLATTLRHEVGHGLGLSHSPSNQEVMFGIIQNNTVKPLGLGDKNGIRQRYPIPPGTVAAAAYSQDSLGAGANEPGDLFGSAAVHGDFNGDGVEDAAIAAEGENNSQGAVVVLYGSVTGLGDGGTDFILGTGSSFGKSLAAGDFNGDGQDDLAAGQPDTNGDRGQVVIFNGGTGGISTFANATLSQDSSGVAGGSEPGDRFGAALTAGDFDNDGRDDLAVGAPGEGLGAIDGAGYIHALYGGSGGLSGSGSDGFSQNSNGIAGGAESGDSFGWALASGDFNNDGRDDLVVGAPGEDLGSRANAGYVHALYGTSGGLSSSSSDGFSQNSSGISGSAESQDKFGTVLATGDFDGDGRDDLVVGVPAEDIGQLSNAGYTHILYGKSGGLSGAGSDGFSQNSGGIQGGAETGDIFGKSVTTGDFDGDGRDDLAIGAEGEGIGQTSNAGYVHVLYGKSSGLSSSGSRGIFQDTSGMPSAAESGDRFGSAVTAGDFDGNGTADLAIGADGENLPGAPNAGVVVGIYGGL